MENEQIAESRPVRASESSRKQRDGSAFTGAFGKKTGSSDLLFLEGTLPEQDGEVARTEPPSRQLEICLENLEAELRRYGKDPSHVLQLTLYLADMDAYRSVNETYEEFFDETQPARTTVGVCELLGGAAVTIDGVVAIE
ncbi:RidA family protein [Natrinema longum]|uniref:RidA family protein n=1 Tax=Natrinema longum TaxID=370324 RepID=A0A8A2UAQ4_9EURY|nr:RidA family protein [Natrinema longum]MBZ6496310.1 RidA family protein [Natrinema longum]QSW85776.1 RidA family protein [Natrinema longum]